MKSLKSKLLIVILAIVVASNAVLTFVAYTVSKAELTRTVKAGMDAVASDAASDISIFNQKQFKMLSTLAVLPVMKNTAVSLKEKYDVAHAVAESDSSYFNVAFYNTEGMSYTAAGLLKDFSDREYFRKSSAGQKFIMSPYVSDVDGKLTMTYSVPVYDDNKNVIGVVAAVVSGQTISDIVSGLTVGKKSQPAVIDRTNGVTIGSSNLDDVKNRQSVSDAPTSEMKAVMQKLCSGATGEGTFYDPGKKQLMAYAYTPVDADCTWSIFSAAPYDDFFGGLKVMVRWMLLSLAISIVLANVICLILISLLIKPLGVVKKTIKEIASGNADLTQRIKVKSQDEIGQVCEGFNDFAAKLQAIVSDVKESKQKLASAGETLEQSSENTASSITQILANIGSMHNQIVGQSSSVEETAGAVNEIASNISSLERMIQNQSSGVTQASAAVEEMIGNIGSVNQFVEKMASSFEELQTNVRTGSAKQQDVNVRITQIENQSQMLQEANQAIANIASQTNLLAMNAAIEAAHAGVSGKGFSVVADEIRKLSETSTAQSKTIGEQLKKIKDSINTVVTASDESNTAFVVVSDKIKETDELVHQIKSAMTEQNEGSRQISEALRSMNDSTSEVRTASVEMSAGNKAILEEVKHLQNATTVMKDSMNEMAEGAEKINATGTALHDISMKMKDSIVQIGNQIDQFKV